MNAKHLWIGIALGSGIFSAYAVAPQTELKNISAKIASVQATLNYDQSQRTYYQQQLTQAETLKAQATHAIASTQQALTQQQQRMQTLQQQQTEYADKIQAQQNQLAQQISAIYSLGRAPTLKLLLSPDDKNRLNRLLTYDRYLNQAQAQTIASLQMSLAQLAENQQQIKHQQTVLTQLASAEQRQQNHLAQISQQRAQIIEQINGHIRSNNEKLAMLLDDQRTLTTTINRLAQASLANFASASGPFDRLQGHLSWPTTGQVLPYFGTQIMQSELRWDGILIKAPENQPVRAIANGQVIFAKWMPGYGLLMIINHGHGYMSLYGRNQALYKPVGAYVKAGDVIGSVGDSGGYAQPALYFALRHNAQPLNPMGWCRA